MGGSWSEITPGSLWRSSIDGTEFEVLGLSSSEERFSVAYRRAAPVVLGGRRFPLRLNVSEFLDRFEATGRRVDASGPAEITVEVGSELELRGRVVRRWREEDGSEAAEVELSFRTNAGGVELLEEGDPVAFTMRRPL